MGRELANLLEDAIDAAASEDNPRADVVAAMASAAGISASTVNQILDGDIDCPPLDRLEGFAQALDVSLDSIISAAESDGCSYGEDDERSCPTAGVQYRDVKLDHKRANDNGLIPAILSSESPVRRQYGFEVLEHSSNSIDLSRAARGLPLLWNHDPSEVVGRVVNVRLDGRVLRGDVREGASRVAKDRFASIKAGDVDGVSIGYELRGEPERVGKNTFRWHQWQVLEASAVAIGADPEAGLFRSHQHIRRRKMDRVDDTTLDDQGTTTSLSRSQRKAADRAVRLERERRDEIEASAELFSHVSGIDELAARAVDEDWNLAKFRSAVEPLIAAAVPKVDTGSSWQSSGRRGAELGMSRGEVESFSILRACQALLQAQLRPGTDPAKLAPFEFECSRALEDQLGREARGLLVPFDVQQHSSWTPEQDVAVRAYELGLTTRTPPMGVGTTGTVAAALKGTQHLASSFIEALRPRSSVTAAGATIIPGLVQDVSIPKQTGLATFTWLAEDADGTDSETPIGAVTLSPKTISGAVPITRKLLKQSAPAVEQIVRSDLIAGAAEGIDKEALQGAGTGNKPTGVLSTSGVLTQTVASAGDPTYAEIVGFETKVNAQNALTGPATYLFNATVYGAAKVKTVDTGSGVFVVMGNMANGHPVVANAQLPANGILFGVFSQLLIGLWGVLDLNVDVATKAKSGGIVLRAFQDIDIAVRHPQAFCKNA